MQNVSMTNGASAGAPCRAGPLMPMSERDLVVPKYVHDLGSSAPHRTIALG